MRVPSSLPYGALGMALFAALGFAAPAQQAQRPGTPSPQNVKAEREPTKLTRRPTQFEWSELVQIQASLPPLAVNAEQPRQAASQQPIGEDPELVRPDFSGGAQSGHTLPDAPQGDIERLGPCASFPGIPPAGSTSWASVVDATGSPYPANAAGSVGPNHLMSMTASDTLIQDRLGATISTVATPTFWSPLAPASVSNCRLNYLGIVGHWVATARGGAGVGTTDILFAVSDTDDPTGGWTFYSIPADPGLTTFADGLFQGYNATWVAVTADMYTTPTGAAGSRLYTMDLPEAIDGDLDPVTFNIFPSSYWPGPFAVTTNYRCVAVRSLDNSIPDLWILNSRTAFGSGENGWAACRLTGTGAAPVFVVTPSPLGSALFIPALLYSNGRQLVGQVGDVRFIDPFQPDGITVSSRVRLQDAVVRNGHIFTVTRTGGAGPQAAAATRNALKFSELDATLPFAIDGTSGVGPFVQDMQIDDGINTTLMYPSIAVNCANDVLIGFSRSDSTKDVEAGYCMRLGTDAPNTMGPTTTLKLGESSWWQMMPPPNAGAFGIWGTYSSASIDPNDDKTLWTLQQYAATRVGGADADSRWGTWWGRFGDCEIRPVITDQPDDFSGCIGDMVTFSVTATTGSNVLTYQWRRNGIDILGANSSSYSIPSIVASDEGMYDVVVCGCGQEISMAAELELNEPTITTQPQDYFAKLGEPAAFYVVATPFLGTMSYQWFHGATPVGIDDDILVIGSVTPFDYGNYTCVITDGCGPTTTTVARLLPPGKENNHLLAEVGLAIIDHPQSQLACDGDQVVFSVNASVNGLPGAATYVWRYNGFPIAPPETNSTLVLSSVTPADDGIYDVVVSLGPKSKASLPASLTVIDIPVITTEPGPVNQTVGPGSDVTYTVVATGGGTVTYQWEFRPQSGGGAVVFSDIPFANGTSHVIEDVTGADNGTYRCKITNECGFVRTRNCRLTVL